MPVPLSARAASPTAVLSDPAVFCWSASKPRAVLLEEVFKLRARNPTAVLKPPMVSEESASKPTAVLSEPLVALTSAPIPKAVLRVTSLHICGHCARAFGTSVSHVRASTSGMRSPAILPQWRDDRFIEFVVGEVFVFIKQPFCSPRLVNCATAGLNEGKKLSGEAPSPGFRPWFLQIVQKVSPACQGNSPQAQIKPEN